YKIHTLLYVNDPANENYFDINFIQTGITTIANLNSRFQSGGGLICGSLDTDGAMFTVDNCNAKLGNFVWEDINANGIQNGGEPGIENVEVRLNGNAPDGEPIVQTTTTDGTGMYMFSNLPPGTYKVTFITPNNFINTYRDQGGNDALDSD